MQLGWNLGTPGDACRHTPSLHRGLGIAPRGSVASCLAPQGSAWRGEVTSLGCWSQYLSPSPALSLYLYLHLVSPVSLPNASLLPFISRGASCASIFSTFASLVAWLLLCQTTLLSRGLAARWILAGCSPGGQGLQLGHPPCCSFGNRFPKTWKVEGWEGWREVVGRACCWGNWRHLCLLWLEPGKPPPARRSPQPWGKGAVSLDSGR